jgi:putative hydrolase of the HAD superfamily
MADRDRRTGQTLLLDADDTLWHNNIYFERAIARFIAYLDHQQHSPAQIREVLYRCEHVNIAAYGYGLTGFRSSLIHCLEELAESSVTDEQREQVAGFAQSIAEQQIELLPGVAETLPRLAQRHRLILVTKGNAGEQSAKLAESGLHQHFTAVEIPPEKHEAAYRAITARYQLAAETTWMIGNSPRSDINPALAAGLHAVYLHHPDTWALEHAALDLPTPPQCLLELSEFRELAEHF